MRRQFQIILMLTLALTSIVFIGVQPIGPIFGSPDNLWSSYGTTHYVGGNLSVTNPKYAYDMKTVPPAAYFDYVQKTGYFNITGFNSTTPLMTNPLPSIQSVSFNMMYNTTANTGDQRDKYRMVYYVGASAAQVLTDWRTDNVTYLYVDGFDDSKHYWQRTGSSPYLGAIDANQINETGVGAIIGDFNFEDTTELSPYTGLYLQIYATTVGTNSSSVRIWLYREDVTPAQYRSDTFDTLTPSNTTWNWETTAYNFAGILSTLTRINNVKLYLEKIGGGGNVKIDAMRFYAPPEYIYKDLTSNGVVDLNDVRLTEVPPYAAGSTVADTHLDVGNTLVAFKAYEKHRENIAVNAAYDVGEYIYNDTDSSGAVSIGDRRLTDVPGFTIGSIVASGNSDIGQTLIAFAGNEKHRENIANDGKYNYYVQKYLYVNGFTDGKKWTRTGSSPYLGALDANQIYQTEGDGVIGDFSFANMPSDYGGKVYIEVNAKQAVGGDDKLELWIYDLTQYYSFVLTPTSSFTWLSTDDVTAERLQNITRINNAKFYLVKKQLGAADRIDVDAVRLKVWNRGAAPVITTATWSNQPKPGGGAWTWSDIGNIRFSVEARHTTGTGAIGAIFYLQEAWLTINLPDAKMKVSPTSVTTTQAATNETLRPNLDGTFLEWDSPEPVKPMSGTSTYTAWTNSYAAWSDPSFDTDLDSSFIGAAANNLNESAVLEDPLVNPFGSIAKVAYTIVARQTTGDEKIRMMLVIGGKGYYGSLVQPTTVYQWFTSEWTTNPATGLAWTWTAVNSLHIGVRSERNGATFDGELRVTQGYVTVLPANIYTYWDEASQNGDTDYVYTSDSIAANYVRASSQLTDPTPPSWDPAAVRVNVYARRTGVAATDQISLSVVVGGREYVSRADPADPSSAVKKFTLTTSYVKYSFDFVLNPRTKLPWTWSDVNALEAGVRAETYVGSWDEMRITQLYVEVLGPRIETTVFCEDVWDMFSFKFSLGFNTTVLTPLGFVPYEPSMTPVVSRVNDTGGYVTAQYNMGAGTKHAGGSSGNRTLAKVIFIADIIGTSSFDLYGTALSNTDGQSIAHKVYDKDVEVDSIGSSPLVTIAYKGYNETIKVAVKNYAAVAYDVTVNTYYNTTLINQTSLLSFASGASVLLSFKWVTAAIPYGDYVIWSEAVITANDVASRTGGTVRLTIPGDINGDKAVDRFDFGLFAQAYGSTAGPPPSGNWNQYADINNDNVVDRFDFGILAQNYGKSWV